MKTVIGLVATVGFSIVAAQVIIRYYERKFAKEIGWGV